MIERMLYCIVTVQIIDFGERPAADIAEKLQMQMIFDPEVSQDFSCIARTV